MSRRSEPATSTVGSDRPPKLLVVSSDVVAERMAGPGIRAWEISRAMAAAGTDVTLAAPGEAPAGDRFATIGYDVRGASLRVAAAAADAIFVQSLILTRYPFLRSLDRPLVVDLYDPFVLENLQVRSSGTPAGRARGLASDVGALLGELERGDFFVCASEKQRDLWLGALLAVGRVNPAAYDEDPELRRLIDLLPFGIPEETFSSQGGALKGVWQGIERGDTVVYWGGGIWDWFDPLTLIEGLADAVVDMPSLKLVFAGGKTPSPSVRGMTMADRARELAADLGVLDRNVFFNRDWVPYAGRAAYLADADIAVSCHLPHLETQYAFRTRMLDYIWAGLPMIVTEGDVLADLVRREGLGVVVPAKSPAAVADALRRLASRLKDDPAAFDAAFARVRPTLTWAQSVRPLVRFMRAPRRAPNLVAAGASSGVRPQVDSSLSGRDVPTPLSQLPVRALELVREGGPLLLAEEVVRYIRWLRRPQ